MYCSKIAAEEMVTLLPACTCIFTLNNKTKINHLFRSHDFSDVSAQFCVRLCVMERPYEGVVCKRCLHSQRGVTISETSAWIQKILTDIRCVCLSVHAVPLKAVCHFPVVLLVSTACGVCRPTGLGWSPAPCRRRAGTSLLLITMNKTFWPG